MYDYDYNGYEGNDDDDYGYDGYEWSDDHLGMASQAVLWPVYTSRSELPPVTRPNGRVIGGIYRQIGGRIGFILE